MWSYEVVPEDEEPYEEFDFENWLFPHWEVVEEPSRSGFHGSEPAFNTVPLAKGSMFPFQPKRLEGFRIPWALDNEEYWLFVHVSSIFARISGH
mgnify:CR=1 FL=1